MSNLRKGYLNPCLMNHRHQFILLILFAVTANAAHAQVYKFNCFQQAQYGYSHVGDTNWIETNFPVNIDFEQKQIDFGNKSSMNFEILNFEPLRQDKNANTIVSRAMDKEGNLCNVELSIFREKSFHIATLVVKYGTVMHSYRLQQNRPARK